jgi:hypothetical protein
MRDEHRTFALESYKQIRTEVSVLLARIENLFRYAMLVSATVFAWVLTQAFGTTAADPAKSCLKLPAEVLKLAWWIPLSFVIVSGLIVLVTHIRVLQMGQFLRRCEETLGDPRLSWELFFAPKFPIFTLGTTAAWALMLWATYHAGTVGMSFVDLAACQAKG